jgi:hypothetical protein
VFDSLPCTNAWPRSFAGEERSSCVIVAPVTPPLVTIEDAALELRLAIWVIDDWRGTPTNRALTEHDRLTWYSLHELPPLSLADERYRDLLREALTARTR